MQQMLQASSGLFGVARVMIFTWGVIGLIDLALVVNGHSLSESLKIASIAFCLGTTRTFREIPNSPGLRSLAVLIVSLPYMAANIVGNPNWVLGLGLLAFSCAIVTIPSKSLPFDGRLDK